MFVDQSGFYPLPGVVKTYAPKGQTPILSETWTRDHLSVMGGITPDGKLYQIQQRRSFKSPDVVRFLQHLLRQIAGPIQIIWDGAPIHRSHVIKEFLASAAGQRLEVVQLPGYAPDLNPMELVWRYLKYVELKNLCCRQLAHLRGELRRAIARLRHYPALLQACIRKCGCY